MPKNSRKRKPTKETPKLERLQYGSVYCELCRKKITADELVAWWKVARQGGRMRWAAYCPECHRANVNAGKALH